MFLAHYPEYDPHNASPVFKHTEHYLYDYFCIDKNILEEEKLDMIENFRKLRRGGKGCNGA